MGRNAKAYRESTRQKEFGYYNQFFFPGSYFHEWGLKDNYKSNKEYEEKFLPFYERYKRFAEHMREGRHNWTNQGDPLYYADNSIEQMQVSQKTGETRRVMLKCPSGDIC